MLSSTLSSCEFGKVAESAKEVLSLVEQLKRQIEQIEPHSGDGIADLEPLVAEADRLIKQAREIRAELEVRC